jgi:hypothetical protein
VTPALLDRPASLFAERATGPLGGGRMTLEERLNAALHEARTTGSTECPVCHACMTSVVEGGTTSAECGCCGSQLT